MFKKILVPVDPAETEFAKTAMETAVGLARQSNGEVRLVAVMPVVSGYVTEYLPADFEANVEKQTADHMRQLAADTGLAADKASIAMRLGSVYHEVLEEAESWGADLIVVSSHRPDMSTYLIGSNATKIVRHAPCSVMVLRQ